MSVLMRKRMTVAFAFVILTLSCRTADVVAQLRPTATLSPSPAPTETPSPIPPPTEVVVIEAQVVTVEATNTRRPPVVLPTRRPITQPTRAPIRPANVRPTPRPLATKPPPTPTSQWPYQIQLSRCGPNVRTFIEGYVYENGTPKNGVIVRISQGPDGQPDPNDDYVTGFDKRRRGYYFHNIDSNAPHAGTWYLWVMDSATQQRISTIAIVKTDPQRIEDNPPQSSGSCQSATVNFSNQGSRTVIRTPSRTPTVSTRRTRTPTPEE